MDSKAGSYYGHCFYPDGRVNVQGDSDASNDWYEYREESHAKDMCESNGGIYFTEDAPFHVR